MITSTASAAAAAAAAKVVAATVTAAAAFVAAVVRVVLGAPAASAWKLPSHPQVSSTHSRVTASADGFLDADCEGDDCDDADEAVNPDAEEVPYDGIDNDCDGEDTVDADGDGFADSSVDGGTDCDDSADAVFPGAEEICDDEIDNDCDDLTDADDDECGACADCESSISASPRGTGLLGLVIALAFGIRRRRS